jgi:hypothetical protein
VRRLEQLRAEARHHRERRDLYRARAYGPHATTPGRLRELEQIATAAEARLRAAESDPSF